MDFKQLEKKRMICMGLYLLFLIFWLAGVFTVRDHRLPGIVMFGLGLACWLTVTFWGKRWYQADCARMRVLRGLGMTDARFIDKQEAAGMGFPAAKLVPGGRAADPPLFLQTAQGTLFNRPVTLTELTQSYHDEGSTKRRYLIGTLARVSAPACREGLMILCGKAYGGTLRAEDFKPLTLLDSQGHAYHALGREGAALTEAQSAALDAFCAEHDKNAVFLTENGSACVFLPMRFYSGSDTPRAPLTEKALEEFPLPELEGALKVLDALGK